MKNTYSSAFNSLIKAASDCFNSGNFEGAIANYTEARKICPNSSNLDIIDHNIKVSRFELCVKQAKIFVENKCFLKAADKFSEAISYVYQQDSEKVLKENRAVMYFRYGCEILNSDPSLAITYLDKAKSQSYDSSFKAKCQEHIMFVKSHILFRDAESDFINQKLDSAKQKFSDAYSLCPAGFPLMRNSISEYINLASCLILELEADKFFKESKIGGSYDKFKLQLAIEKYASSYRMCQNKSQKERLKKELDNAKGVSLLLEATSSDNFNESLKKLDEAEKLFSDDIGTVICSKLKMVKISDKYFNEGYDNFKNNAILEAETNFKLALDNCPRDYQYIDKRQKIAQNLLIASQLVKHKQIFDNFKMNQNADEAVFEYGKLCDVAVKSEIEVLQFFRNDKLSFMIKKYFAQGSKYLEEDNFALAKKNFDNALNLVYLNNLPLNDVNGLDDITAIKFLKKLVDDNLNKLKLQELKEVGDLIDTAHYQSSQNFFFENPFIKFVRDLDTNLFYKRIEEMSYKPDSELEKQENAEKLLVTKLKYLINTGIDKLRDIKDQEILVYLGNTKSGKSTIINTILGNALYAEKSGRKIHIKNIDDTESGPKIGDKSVSETTVPGVYRSKEGSLVCDCPGFMDNRGVTQEIANSFYIKHILDNSSSFKLFLVSDYNDIDSDNISSFLSMIEIVVKMFDVKYTEDFSLLQQMMNSGSIVLMVNKSADNIEDVKERYKDQFLFSDVKKSESAVELMRYFLDTDGKMCVLPKITSDGEIGDQLLSSISEIHDGFCKITPDVKINAGLSSESQYFLDRYFSENALKREFGDILSVLEDILSGLDLDIFSASSNLLSELDYKIKSKLELLSDIFLKIHGAFRLSDIFDVIKNDFPKIFDLTDSGIMENSASCEINREFDSQNIEKKVKFLDFISDGCSVDLVKKSVIVDSSLNFIATVKQKYLLIQHDIKSRIFEIEQFRNTEKEKLLLEKNKALEEDNKMKLKYNIFHVSLEYDNPFLNDKELIKKCSSNDYKKLLEYTSTKHKYEVEDILTYLHNVEDDDFSNEIDMLVRCDLSDS